MYKMNQANSKFQIPSANLNKMFESKPPTNMVRVDPPINTTPQYQQPQVEKYQEIEDNSRAEFETLVRERLGKIDEVLLLLKEKQETMNKPIEVTQEKQAPQQIPQSFLQPKPKIEKADKAPRSKRTYYNITENMWGEVRSRFPDLPEEFKTKTYSDGTEFYVESKNKKLMLDNKTVLKILNQK
jgi:hypothetical protein